MEHRKKVILSSTLSITCNLSIPEMDHDYQYFFTTSSTATKSFPAQQKHPHYYSFGRQGNNVDKLILTFFFLMWYLIWVKSLHCKSVKKICCQKKNWNLLNHNLKEQKVLSEDILFIWTYCINSTMVTLAHLTGKTNFLPFYIWTILFHLFSHNVEEHHG